MARRERETRLEQREEEAEQSRAEQSRAKQSMGQSEQQRGAVFTECWLGSKAGADVGGHGRGCRCDHVGTWVPLNNINNT